MEMLFWPYPSMLRHRRVWMKKPKGDSVKRLFGPDQQTGEADLADIASMPFREGQANLLPGRVQNWPLTE
jgi:hypothetical protein